MANIEVRKNGVLKVFLLDVTASAIERHISNGYPDLAEDYVAGLLTITEIVGEPIVTPEDVADQAARTSVQEEEKIRTGLLRILLTDRFGLENRLRVLAGKASVTREQFLDAVKARLGL